MGELWVVTQTVQPKPLNLCQNPLFTDGNDFSILGHSQGQSLALWSFVGC